MQKAPVPTLWMAFKKPAFQKPRLTSSHTQYSHRSTLIGCRSELSATQWKAQNMQLHSKTGKGGKKVKCTTEKHKNCMMEGGFWVQNMRWIHGETFIVRTHGFDLHSGNNCALPPSPCIRCCQRSGQFKPTPTENMLKIIYLNIYFYKTSRVITALLRIGFTQLPSHK